MKRARAPLERFSIPRKILNESQELLAEPGVEGYEAVVVWVGHLTELRAASIDEVIRPAQVARRSLLGCSVEVPPDALSDLIRNLEAGTFVVARVHTHPAEAFHSELDDTNMLVGHIGAISIVVPYFAHDPIDLLNCSINELTVDAGWVELVPAEVTRRFHIDD